MAAKRYTVDTNILFYAIDSRDAKKHARALELIHRGNSDRFRVLLQTLGELCNSISRRQPALRQQAEQMVDLLQQIYSIVPAAFEDLTNALALQRQHQLQFWDTMLTTTAKRAGCTTLLSEDMQDTQHLNGITIRNPFRMADEEFQSYLA